MSATPYATTAGVHQFWRSYQVTIETGPGVGKLYGNVNAGASNLRLAFSVTRSIAGPGPRALTLTNLNPVSRNAILAVPQEANTDASAGFHLGSRVTVQAGYSGAVDTVLVGYVTKCTSERAGADIHTHLDMIDGEAFGNQCVFSQTYAASKSLAGGVKLSAVLADIATAMQLSSPSGIVRIVGGVVVGVPERTYPKGLTLNGTCAQALHTVLSPLGLDFTIDSGALSIVPRSHYDAREVVVLSPKTGLINTPSTTFRYGRNVVLFDALLNTRIAPSRLVAFADTPSLPGYYKVLTSKHEGDTHGANWTVSCEAERYDGVIGTLPSVITSAQLGGS